MPNDYRNDELIIICSAGLRPEYVYLYKLQRSACRDELHFSFQSLLAAVPCICGAVSDDIVFVVRHMQAVELLCIDSYIRRWSGRTSITEW